MAPKLHLGEERLGYFEIVFLEKILTIQGGVYLLAKIYFLQYKKISRAKRQQSLV